MRKFLRGFGIGLIIAAALYDTALVLGFIQWNYGDLAGTPSAPTGLIAYVIVPAFILVAYGDWFPVLFVYGGIGLGLLLYYFGDRPAVHAH